MHWRQNAQDTTTSMGRVTKGQLRAARWVGVEEYAVDYIRICGVLVATSAIHASANTLVKYHIYILSCYVLYIRKTCF